MFYLCTCKGSVLFSRCSIYVPVRGVSCSLGVPTWGTLPSCPPPHRPWLGCCSPPPPPAGFLTGSLCCPLGIWKFYNACSYGSWTTAAFGALVYRMLSKMVYSCSGVYPWPARLVTACSSALQLSTLHRAIGCPSVDMLPIRWYYANYWISLPVYTSLKVNLILKFCKLELSCTAKNLSYRLELSCTVKNLSYRALLKTFWQILLYATDDAVAKLFVT